MTTHEEMVGFQSEKHDLVDAKEFSSLEEYILHLIHLSAYLQISCLVKDKKVLDFGCNTGYGTELLSRSATAVAGVDVSQKAIARAQQLYGHHGIDFQCTNGTSIPFGDKAFDVIVNFQVIEHIVDCSTYLSEINRVMAPDGIVVFTTPNALLRLAPGMKPWNRFHAREYDHRELMAVLINHFHHVSLLGLFAVEPLYSREVQRLARSRDNAVDDMKSMTSPWASSPYAFAKRLIPQQVLALAKRIRTHFTKKSLEECAALTGNRDIDDLFYFSDKLDTALNLLAVCSHDEAALKNSISRFTIT